jgi:hypothetical protein
MQVSEISGLKTMQWLAPWEAFPDVERSRTKDGAEGYDLELVREVGPKHSLFPHKCAAIPIGVRCDCDDRLYWIPDDQHPFVVVHLTWAGVSEQSSSNHPSTEFYNSLAAWFERRMRLDHELYISEP